MNRHSRKDILQWLAISCLILGSWICSGLVSVSAAEPAARRTENVILVTYDGLRWQDLFRGADETLLNREHGGVRDLAPLKETFWRESPEERRELMMPFFWQVVAKQGQVFGAPETNSVARVTNGHNFSYPGYSEILTGHADPRIDSNAKRPNPNVTVLEWLNGRDGFRGRVAAFCSWDVFPFIINAQRSGVPVNAGWEPLEIAASPEKLESLNSLARELPHTWQNVRYDAFTFHGALDYLKLKKPRCLYVSLGETDDWAHDGRYDLYLDAARRNDDYVRKLWEASQSMPEYAGKTSLILTTDHGRGDTRTDWKSHGKLISGSDRMWIAVLGPDTPPDGLRQDTHVTQSQVAATVAALLGEDYHGAVPQSAPALPGVLRNSEK